MLLAREERLRNGELVLLVAEAEAPMNATCVERSLDTPEALRAEVFNTNERENSLGVDEYTTDRGGG